MTEDTDKEEFEKFVRDNREMILRILEEDDGYEEYDAYDSYVPRYSAADRFHDEYAEPFKKDLRELGNTVLRVLADEEVQKHFTLCAMEFLAFAEASIRALPMSDESRELFDEAVKAKDEAMKNVAVTGAKNVTKSKLEKISISNVKKKFDDLFPERDADQSDGRSKKS